MVAGAPRPSTHHPRAPAATAAAPPATTERRCTDRRRSSTRAAGSGGSPWPASRCSTTASRSTSSAQSAGARPSAARAASWAATSRACRAAARARTSVTGIPSRSATSSGPVAQIDRAPRRARSRGVAARTTASSAVSTGSSSSASVHGFGDDTASGLGGRDGRGQHRTPGRRPGPPLVEGLAPLLVERGQGVGGDPAGRGGVEGDDERDALEVGPARGHEIAEVVLDGEGHPTSLTPGGVRRTGLFRPVQHQRSAAAPSSASSWLSSLAGSNSPVTSQMTRWPTLTAWSANRS